MMAVQLPTPPSRPYRDPYSESERLRQRVQDEVSHRVWVEGSLATLLNALNLHMTAHHDHETKLLELVRAISEDCRSSPRAADVMPRTIEAVAGLVMDRIEERDT